MHGIVMIDHFAQISHTFASDMRRHDVMIYFFELRRRSWPVPATQLLAWAITAVCFSDRHHYF